MLLHAGAEIWHGRMRFGGGERDGGWSYKVPEYQQCTKQFGLVTRPQTASNDNRISSFYYHRKLRHLHITSSYHFTVDR